MHLNGCTSQAQFESAFENGFEGVFEQRINVYIGVVDLPDTEFKRVCLTSSADYNLKSHFDKTYELAGEDSPTSRDAYNAFLADMGWAATESPKRSKMAATDEADEVDETDSAISKSLLSEKKLHTTHVVIDQETEVRINEPAPAVEPAAEPDDIPPSMLKRKQPAAAAAPETVDLTQTDDA
jgi:hypothetical protein